MAALDAFEREQPHLAVLDINMPRMNGFELAQKLRERSRIPLLMLTARSEEDRRRARVEHRRRRLLEQAVQPEDPDRARQGAAAPRRRRAPSETVAVGSLSLDVPELMLLGLAARARAAHAARDAVPAAVVRARRPNRVDRPTADPRLGQSRRRQSPALEAARASACGRRSRAIPADPRLVRNVPNAGYLFDPAAVSSDARGPTA